jgi:hypothetical protein
MSPATAAAPPAKPTPASIRDQVQLVDRYLLEAYSRAQVTNSPSVVFSLATIKGITQKLTAAMIDLEAL